MRIRDHVAEPRAAGALDAFMGRLCRRRVVVGIQVGAHGHALIRTHRGLQLADGDAGRGKGVETGAEIAGVALREAAFHLQERGEHDHQHHHRRHDGQREHEGKA